MRVALKFGYNGTKFWGYQRQPGVRTVEGEVIQALKKTKIIRDVRESNFQSSSRTDRGASAIGNVIAFNTKFRKGSILKALNSKVRDVYFWGISEVLGDFNPRHARQRWYRYHLDRDLDMDRLKSASSLFVGRHDFKSFCRKGGGSTVREIDSIQVSKKRNFIYLDIRAESFLWHMVRRIVSALAQYSRGEVTKRGISEALAGRAQIRGCSPPHPLFLMDVSYDFTFEVERPSLLASIEKDHKEVLIREELFSGLKRTIG